MGWRRGTRAILALVAVPALALAGCGSKDYPNDPRPPISLELTASINDRGVRIEPDRVGYGDAGQPINQNEGVAEPGADPDDQLTVNITISNTTNTDVRLILSGPTEVRSEVIPARGFGELKTGLETGMYRVRVPELERSISNFLTVGPDRVSSQNALLLP
jgi:hypothetical protein